MASWFNVIDPTFKALTNEAICACNDILTSRDIVGVKELRKWYRRNVTKGVKTKLSVAYWLNRGYDVIDARDRVVALQSMNSRKRFNRIKELKLAGDVSWKKQFNMNTEYYVSRGMTNEQAIKAVRERQATFSLQKCVAHYGLPMGIEMWKQRQDKWQVALASRSDAEKLDTLRRKVVPLGRASRESLAIFGPLHSVAVEHGIDDSQIYYGYKDRNEWYLGGLDEFYLYDFTIPSLKLIIEYQGKVWHPHPSIVGDELLRWKTPTGIAGNVIRDVDKRKREFAEKRGYTVVDLWAHDGPLVNMEKASIALKECIERTTLTVPISTVGRLLQRMSVQVSSPDGFVDILQFHEKRRPTFKILLEDGTSLICSDDHYVKLETGQWACIRDLRAAPDVTYGSLRLLTCNGPKFIIAMSVHSTEQVVNDLTVDHPNCRYYSAGIESHNTGKTLLALAAALEQLKGIGSPTRAVYEKLIVTRPVQPVGKEIGFLPGTLAEKMEPWIAPIRDNLNFLVNNKRPPRARKGSTENGKPRHDEGQYLSLMQERGLIEIEAITFIRGRSIPNAFIVIDEAQNLSMHELKTIITRVGDGTKIVLTGDIEQIDNVHVDAFTNGLTYAVERFKDYPIAAHVTLVKGERSALATLASQIL
jgi:hypothetical protein